METITLMPEPATGWSSQLPEGVIILPNSPAEKESSFSNSPFRLGPVFFAGRSPFRIRVMILTCFAIPENSTDEAGSYVTYVGYKKEADPEFDFDEMIPSTSAEDALKTHSRACGFFG
ncbi:MAG: hypothetical protein ABIO46_08050, partial [Chitinophagales bacterium]